MRKRCGTKHWPRIRSIPRPLITWACSTGAQDRLQTISWSCDCSNYASRIQGIGRPLFCWRTSIWSEATVPAHCRRWHKYLLAEDGSVGSRGGVPEHCKCWDKLLLPVEGTKRNERPGDSRNNSNSSRT